MTEQELAAHVVEYLKKEGWEVYQEVQPNWKSGIADIVGVKDQYGCVVEVKKALTAAAIEQAWAWRGHIEYLYVAVPEVRRWVRGRNVLLRFCELEGIGVLGVNQFTGKLREVVFSRPHDILHPGQQLKRAVREEHKDFCAAGSASGGHYTKFKGTCRAWREYVEEHPGCTMKEVAEAAGHHYASLKSACGTMPRNIEQGLVPGVRAEKEQGVWRLYPKELTEDDAIAEAHDRWAEAQG